MAATSGTLLCELLQAPQTECNQSLMDGRANLLLLAQPMVIVNRSQIHLYVDTEHFIILKPITSSL